MHNGFTFSDLTFPADASVLGGVTFSIGATESVALFGPNGGGKSSVMRVIAGTARGAERSADAAYLPQTPYLFRGSVGANLTLGLDDSGAQVALRLADELGVATLLGKPSQEVSVGEAQRVCIARTLASSSPLVLLDEPLAPIGAAARDMIGATIAHHTANRALLWATHSLEVVRSFADRLIIVDQGAILQDGPVEDVLASPATEGIAEILGVES